MEQLKKLIGFQESNGQFVCDTNLEHSSFDLNDTHKSPLTITRNYNLYQEEVQK